MKRTLALLLFMLVGLTGCFDLSPMTILKNLLNANRSNDESSSTPAPPPGPPPVTLVSITVSPESASIPVGLSQPFTVFGNYSDGNKIIITSAVTWSIIPKTPIAYIYGNQAYGREPGTAVVKAEMGDLFAEAALTVRPKEATSVGFLPESARVGVGSFADFLLSVQFTDGSYEYGQSVSCEVNDASVAVVAYSGPTWCRIQSVGPGTATVTASTLGLSCEATIEVWPFRPFLTDSTIAPFAAIGVEAAGEALVILKGLVSTPGALAWSRVQSATDWSPPAEIEATPPSGWGPVTLKPAGDGSALLIGTSDPGIYSTRYLPGLGWQSLETITTDSTIWGQPGASWNASGNGLVVWSDGTDVFGSDYETGRGWSSPVNLGPGWGAAVDLNDTGKAVVVWNEFRGSLPGTADAKFTPRAVVYSTTSGWGEPIDLDIDEFANNPRVRINDAGEGLVVWQRYYQSYRMMSAQLQSDGTWTAPTVAAEAWPCSSNVEIDADGNGLLLCEGTETVAYYYLAGSGWQSGVGLGEGSVWSNQMRMDESGNAVMVWGDNNIVKIKRFSQAQGWQATESMELPSNDVYVLLEMNPAGDAVIVWNDTYYLLDEQTLNYQTKFQTFVAPLPEP